LKVKGPAQRAGFFAAFLILASEKLLFGSGFLKVSSSIQNLVSKFTKLDGKSFSLLVEAGLNFCVKRFRLFRLPEIHKYYKTNKF
jgi:hypothetical protein